MTNKDKAFFKKFYDLSLKQSYCQLWLAIQHSKKSAEQLDVIKAGIIEKRAIELSKEINNMIMENEQAFLKLSKKDVEKLQLELMTIEHQFAISEEVLGQELLLKDLAEQVDTISKAQNNA